MARVACDSEAVSASQQLQGVIGGQLEQVMSQFQTHGSVLSDPTHWDGRHAVQFREAWGRAQVDLRNFHNSVREVLAAAQRVQSDILSAGGNA